MAEMERLHQFAVKWCGKFRDENLDYRELSGLELGQDCSEVEFIMDCGNAFSHRYNDAFYDFEALAESIYEIADIQLLGSAIYSKWYYFNHWAESGEEILESANREWFIIALGRLAMLTGENIFLFHGEPKSIRIVSNILGTKAPMTNGEIEQHLTITDNGDVSFIGYGSCDDSGSASEFCKENEIEPSLEFSTIEESVENIYEKKRSLNFKIDKEAATKLVDVFSGFFSRDNVNVFGVKNHNWKVEITNTEGEVYKFNGHVWYKACYEGIELSDYVRSTVEIDDLYMFDGNNKPDVIERITLDYHRVSTNEYITTPGGLEPEVDVWNNKETFILDRATDTLEFIQKLGDGIKVSRKYEIKNGTKLLLDYFGRDHLFYDIKGNPGDVVETPDEIKDYKIKVEYKNSPKRVITGSFDKYGLPDDFPDFAEKLLRYISIYTFSEALAPKMYGTAKRRASDYIYCSVTFGRGNNTYYYLTDDDTIVEGDFVIVPAGFNNQETVVKVVNVEYFSEDKVPLPLEKTKRIIRKCTIEDFENYDEFVE